MIAERFRRSSDGKHIIAARHLSILISRQLPSHE
jgi:hypothetical protein